MRLLLGLILFLLFFFILKFNRLPPQIPLFYSRPEGEEQLVDWWFIFLLPIMMIIFYFLNTFVNKKFFLNDQLIEKIFFWLNLINIIILTLIFLKIIILVT